MRWYFINMLIKTTGVSFTLIALLFSFLSLVTEEVGPTDPSAMLLLFAMCVLIALWTSFLRLRDWERIWVYILLAYGGCVSIVLGLGQATGFIPLDQSDPATIALVLLMITSVFAGTAGIAYIRVKADEKQINTRLEQKHLQREEDKKRPDR